MFRFFPHQQGWPLELRRSCGCCRPWGGWRGCRSWSVSRNAARRPSFCGCWTTFPHPVILNGISPDTLTEAITLMRVQENLLCRDPCPARPLCPAAAAGRRGDRACPVRLRRAGPLAGRRAALCAVVGPVRDRPERGSVRQCPAHLAGERGVIIMPTFDTHAYYGATPFSSDMATREAILATLRRAEIDGAVLISGAGRRLRLRDRQPAAARDCLARRRPVRMGDAERELPRRVAGGAAAASEPARHGRRGPVRGAGPAGDFWKTPARS